MAINSVQSALSSALSGLRRSTTESDNAASDIQRATLTATQSTYAEAPSSGGANTQASPDLYAAVATRIEARQRFSTSMSVLRTADQLLRESTRLL